MGYKYLDKVFFKNSSDMSELPDSSVQLIVTSPPYYNVKDYSLDGYQRQKHSQKKKQDIGAAGSLSNYLKQLLSVWKECERVLKPNGKLCVNVPLMPLLKRDSNTHYNRDIIDLQSQIQTSILQHTHLFLLDLYIWNRINSSKRLMFGSYPYPRNFYAQNTCEFITVFVKAGLPENNIDRDLKEKSRLTAKEWVLYTKQIWDIPIPNKKDSAFGKHPALMPEEIAKRCIRMYSLQGDLVLDPFAGSGTTLKMAHKYGRHYVGYELYPHYKKLIEQKLKE